MSTVTQLAISGLLIWLTLVAGQMGYANLHYFSANNQLGKWVSEGAISSESSYQQALQAISLSNDLHPDNPQYIETLAAIQEWAVYGGYAKQSNFSLALANYDKAIQLRPLWPWTWSAKVMTKWRLREIDDEMWHALVKLGETGPYTMDANLVIVDVSLMLISTGSVYADRAKVLAAEHYRRGMGNSRAVKPLKAVVSRHRAEDIVASW